MLLLLAMAGVVALALRPDWKQEVSDRVKEVRSRLLPEVQKLVEKPLPRSPGKPDVRPPKVLTSQDLVEEALAISENGVWRQWCASRHELVLPRPRMEPVPFVRWEDESACIEVWEADRPRMRRGCTPPMFTVRSLVDAAAAEAIEAHFGVPTNPLWFMERPGSQDAILSHVAMLAASHGVIWSGRSRHYDPSWIVGISVPLIAELAEQIVTTTSGRESHGQSDRAVVEALAVYVQSAIPYRLIEDTKDGNARLGLRTPLMTLLKGGDCDSKCLLLATLVRALRPSLPMEIIFVRGEVNSVENDHAVLAVGIAPARTEWKRNMQCGVPGVLIESTSSWGISKGFKSWQFLSLEPFVIR
jgi:hypothetical protein